MHFIHVHYYASCSACSVVVMLQCVLHLFQLEEVVKQLIAAHANVTYKTRNGLTALNLAQAGGHHALESIIKAPFNLCRSLHMLAAAAAAAALLALYFVSVTLRWLQEHLVRSDDLHGVGYHPVLGLH